MKPENAKKILFLIQLPPPVHGVSIINEILVNNDELRTKYNIKIINLATSKSISGIGKINLSKIYNSFIILLNLIKTCAFFRPDLVYITFSPSGPAFLRDTILCLIVKLFNVKLLIHMHGKGLINLNHKSTHGRLASIVFRNSNVISLSNGLKNDLKHLSPSNVFTLANGISTSNSQVARTKNDNKINLLYLSNLVRTKGIIDLIDALEIVKESNHNWQLSIVGNEGDITFSELNNYTENKGLKSNICVLGPKYGEEKYQQLAAADVFVFPTYYPNECFPLVLLEAMQYKLCVITTYEGAIPEIISDGQTGLLFRQQNIHELAERIKDVLSNHDKLQSLATKGQLEFFEKYTSQKMNKEFMQILSQLLS